jgi:hypothetical protein
MALHGGEALAFGKDIPGEAAEFVDVLIGGQLALLGT